MPLCKIRAILGAMLSPGDSAEVDRLIDHLRGAVRHFGNFRADLGATAMLTFTEYFARTLVSLAPQDERQGMSERLAAAFTHMAEDIEMFAAAISDSSGQVH